MQGNLQLADMPVPDPFGPFINAIGIGAQASAPYAALAAFAFFGAMLVGGVFLAVGLKKVAERARYRRFRRLVVAGLHAKPHKVQSVRMLERT